MSLKLDFSNIQESDTITKEEILAKISEVDIIEYYLNIKLKYNTIINSPFRKDRNPSFSFKIGEGSSVLAKDFGSGETFDCFNIVQKLYNCNFFEALKIISTDFKIKDYNNITDNSSLLVNNTKDELYTKYLIDKQKNIISIQKQAFTKTDIDYWSKYHIPIKTLVKFDVFSCKYVWYNKSLIKTYSNNNPVYAYRFIESDQYVYKIYCPFKDKKYKWLFNGSSVSLEGYNQLPLFGDVLIITKSMKDVMSLHELGYNSVSLQAEGNKLQYDTYIKLSKRFNKIVILYDNDDCGIRNSNKLAKEYNINQIMIPLDSKCKDIADYIEIFGIEKSKELIKCLIN
jgi:Crassvirales DNA primase